MTTCAYRDGVLAYDTQVTMGSSIHRTVKAWELSDGSLFTGCGSLWMIKRMKLWCEAGRPKEWIPDFEDAADDDIFSCLHVCDDGVWMIDHRLEPFLFEDEFLAIGSGEQYATGAMDRGATAVEAVETSARHDTYTSAPIKHLIFAGQKKAAKKVSAKKKSKK